MAKATTVTPTPVYDPYPLDIYALVRLFVVGLLAGVVGWLLYLAITHYFVSPIFCRSADTFSICNNGGAIAWVSAHVIVLAAAVATMARLGIYRPLLVALAVLAALWGAHTWLGGLPWYTALGWQALLFGLAMALFGWVARISNFLFALIVTLLLVIVARFILMSA
jgi:hypothetical protein